MSYIEFLIVAAVLGTSFWSWLDSTKLRENGGDLSGLANTHPIVWLVGCLLLWIIVFPTYLLVRPQLVRATTSGDRHADDISRLERLGNLRERGVLTEDEFLNQKTKILKASEQQESATPILHTTPPLGSEISGFTSIQPAPGEGARVEGNHGASHLVNRLQDAAVAYFARTKTYPTWRLVLEMGLVPFIPKLCFGFVFGIFALIFGIEPTESNSEQIISDDGIFLALFVGLLVVPFIETFIGQWLPIFITGKFTKRVVPLVTVSTVIFSLAHISWGLATFVSVIPTSIFLAWCFLIGQEESCWKAYWTTSVAHSIHNAVAMGIAILLLCFI